MATPENNDAEIEREERAIYAIMVAAGVPILIALGWQQRIIDGGNALISMLAVVGIVGLLASLHHSFRRRIPRAKALDQSDVPGSSRNR